MPIVFDEVVGTVEPEAPHQSEEPKDNTPPREPDLYNIPPVRIQGLWKRMEQRLQRLWAD